MSDGSNLDKVKPSMNISDLSCPESIERNSNCDTDCVSEPNLTNPTDSENEIHSTNVTQANGDQKDDCSDSLSELTEEEKQDRKRQTLKLKTKGNDCFKTGEYEDAINFYTEGLQLCPLDYVKDISVLLANRAACYVKMGEHTQAIADCSSALELDEYYIKARLRRAQSYEATEKLDEALEDYKRVLELDRSCLVAGEAMMRLPEQIKERNEKLKDEMLGKLKDLGNMVLKPFGFSTDNFKFQQDPNTGGYNINFQK